MKKSFTIILSLILVFSIITPAFANNVPSIQEKYEILRDAGILDGNNGVMLPEDELMQRQMLAKIACQLMGVSPTPDVEIPAYAEDKKINVWGFDEGWIQAAFNDGLMEGYTYEDGTTTFNANGIVTMGELMTVIIRALGLEDKVVEVEGPWYKAFMNLAVTEGLVQPDTDGASKVKYGDLIKHTYATYQNNKPQEEEPEEEKPEEPPTRVYIAPIVDSTAPTFITVTMASNNIDTTKSKVGDVITLTIVANENIAEPTVTIGGNTASIVSGVDAMHWTATYTMQTGDTEGRISFTLDADDTSGNSAVRVTDITGGTVVTFDKTAPTFTTVTMASNNIDTTKAKAGDLITLTIEANENIAEPTVTINGNTASIISGVDAMHWTATYTLQTGDTEGRISFSLDADDTSGNSAVQVIDLTGGTVVSFDKTAPTITSAELKVANTSITLIFSEDITGTYAANDGGFIVTGNSTPSSYEVTDWAPGGAANEIDLTVADFSDEMGEGKLGVTVTYYTGGNGDIGDIHNNYLSTDTTGVALSGELTPPTVSSVVLADNTTKGDFIDSDDTITIVFSEAINSTSIDASLTTDNPIQGTLIELLGKVGSFETSLTVDAGSNDNNTSSLAISSDLTTITITASGYTGGVSDTEPAGAFTPLSTIKDLCGNSINVTMSPIATGTFDENPPLAISSEEISIADKGLFSFSFVLKGDGDVGNSRWTNSGLMNGDKITYTVSGETATFIISDYHISSLKENTSYIYFISEEVQGFIEFSGTIGTFEAFNSALTSGISVTVNLVDLAGNSTSIPGIVAK